MGTLTLIPSAKAIKRGLAGFQQGKPLKLNFREGEPISNPLNRFNTYRMPENQIQSLFKDPNLTQNVPLQTQLFADLSLYVP